MLSNLCQRLGWVGLLTLIVALAGPASAQSELSATATEAATGAPVITVEPAPQVVRVGATVTLRVTATGSTALAYQWRRDGEPLAGAAAKRATYAFKTTLAHAGHYDVVVTDRAGRSTTSALVSVVVQDIPRITRHPTGLTTDAETDVVLRAAATGSPEPSYQWHHNGQPIPNATHPNLVLTDVTIADSGRYTVTVTNQFGTATSRIASLVVRDAPLILDSPDPMIVPAGQTARLQVTALSYPAPSYQWRKNGVAIKGATKAIYTFKATLAHAGDYDVVVRNNLGQDIAPAFGIVVTAAPLVTRPPVKASLREGAAHSLSVQATGYPAPTYQWLRDGVELPNRTEPTLSFASAALTDTGSYTVRVTNAHGSVVTKPVALDVSRAPFASSARSTFELTGSYSDFDGESGPVSERHTYPKGKLVLRDFADPSTTNYNATYVRRDASTGRVGFTVRQDGISITVAYTFTFTTATSGTFVTTVTAPGFGQVSQASGTFVYSE